MVANVLIRIQLQVTSKVLRYNPHQQYAHMIAL